MNHFFDLGVKAAERPIQWWQRFHLSKQHNMVWTLKICEFVWDICLHLFTIIFDKTFAWFHQHTSNTACTWDFKLWLFYHFFFSSLPSKKLSYREIFLTETPGHPVVKLTFRRIFHHLKTYLWFWVLKANFLYLHDQGGEICNDKAAIQTM